MKYILPIFLITCIIFLACRPELKIEPTTTESPSTSIVFDSMLATKLGADEYGMRQYVLAFLKAGPNRDQDSTETAQLMRKHLDNIKRMAEEGKLAVAGPFLDEGDIRGIYIFNVKTIEEAKALTETDPAIQEGRLIMELHPWYGSAGLMTVNEVHKKIAKNKI
ncbi:MAG TPA: YciI family protein [Saprospiraceae bacterium]|nr:YciI family protein [Saprospiraceae bacterium]